MKIEPIILLYKILNKLNKCNFIDIQNIQNLQRTHEIRSPSMR